MLLDRKKDVVKTLQEAIYSRTFFYMGLTVALNGVDKTSLELAQMGKRNIIKKRLKRKYKALLNAPLETNKSESTGDFVWTSWLQGENAAPKIVKKSINSIRKNFKNKNVVVIDKNNINDYVTLPTNIMEKWKKGIISNAHFSDILRTYLLLRYGGVWVDATVLLKKLPDSIAEEIDHRLFFFQNLRPGQSGNAIWLSSWLISARENEPVLKRTYELLIKYWEDHKRLDDYFLFHIILHLVLENNQSVMNAVKKVPNSLPLMLMYCLRDDENQEVINETFNRFPIQKVTYKKMPEEGSNYNYLEINEIV